MLIIYKKYENSIIATMLSFLGTGITWMCIILFIVDIFNPEFDPGIDEPIGYLVVIVFGLTSMWSAKHLSQRKQFKTLVKTLKEKGYEEHISSSVDFALNIYKNCQTSYVEKYISRMNPQAGQIIQECKQKTSAK